MQQTGKVGTVTVTSATTSSFTAQALFICVVKLVVFFNSLGLQGQLPLSSSQYLRQKNLPVTQK